jgi:hypothetical protein
MRGAVPFQSIDTFRRVIFRLTSFHRTSRCSRHVLRLTQSCRLHHANTISTRKRFTAIIVVLKQSCNRHAFVSDACSAAELQRSLAHSSYMGIDLEHTLENGSVLESVGDPGFLFAEALNLHNLTNTICLKFIDPYGDTTFNQLQIPTLIHELEWLLGATSHAESRKVISEYLRLAKEALGEIHTYLKFIGD